MNEPKPEDRIALLEQEVSEMRKLLTEVARKQQYPKYLTKEEVAEMLQLSPRTILDMVSQGRIPFCKAGSVTRFKLDDIVEWTEGRWHGKPRLSAVR